MEVAELFLNVLRTNEHLYPGTRWTERRLAHLGTDRVSLVHSSDYVGIHVLSEFETAARLLKQAEIKRFLGRTKARR